jgi:pimeloyl-ACP methyl ester carboxylesterase
LAILTNHGIEIRCEAQGVGPPVVLVHGYASNLTLNWQETSWFKTLVDGGYRVIGLDCRGHGLSAKPHEPELYTNRLMGSDVLAVMDEIGVDQAHVMGYSMGAMILLELALAHPDRVTSLTLAGVGDTLLKGGRGDSEEIAKGMEAASPEEIVHPVAQGFRAFAERQKGDLAALAACMRGRRSNIDVAALGRFGKPVLVVAGEKDTMIGDPAPLAAAFPQSELIIVPHRDHMKAVADPVYKNGFLEFASKNSAEGN